MVGICCYDVISRRRHHSCSPSITVPGTPCTLGTESDESSKYDDCQNLTALALATTQSPALINSFVSARRLRESQQGSAQKGIEQLRGARGGRTRLQRMRESPVAQALATAHVASNNGSAPVKNDVDHLRGPTCQTHQGSVDQPTVSSTPRCR